MNTLELKIRRAIETKKFNIEILGERNWYNYFIRVSELVWVRNNYDGYQIEVYSDCSKINHLGTVII